MAPGCGKKGAILAPLTLVPQSVESLTALQRGGLIILEWANPAAYVDGRPLGGIAEIEIWLEQRPDPPPVPAGAKPAPVGAKPAPPAKLGDFVTRAKRIAVLTGAPKAPSKAAAPKGKKPATPAAAPKAAPNAVHLYRLDPKVWAGRSFVFALRVRDARKGRLSDFSPEVIVRPKGLAASPENLRAAVFADRIEVRWAPPAANFDGSTPPLVKGFNIYRGEPGIAVRRINAAPVAASVFADREVVFGRTYVYFVRAAGAAAEPFLESEDSAAVEVRPKDVFPPAVPAGLSAVKGPDFITLVWDAVADPDAAGYHVWRREKGKGEFLRLTASPVPEPTYADKSVEKNVTYEYTITSVDATGNESPKSAVIEETIRTWTP
jgi:hypothetical protein